MRCQNNLQFFGAKFPHNFMPFDSEVEREQWALESDKSLLAEIESQALNESSRGNGNRFTFKPLNGFKHQKIHPFFLRKNVFTPFFVGHSSFIYREETQPGSLQ